MSSLETMLSRRRGWIVAAILVSSLSISGVYFLELSRGPCIWQHRWDQSDMHFFDAWARILASGDWLQDRSLHPHLEWHGRLAASYFRENPEERAALEQEGAGAGEGGPERALWDRWYGGRRYHQAPLYPYLIAFTYRIAGPDARWVLLWQMMLGAAIPLLVYAVAVRAFGRIVAVVAALLAVLCAPLLLYQLVLLRVTLFTFLALLAVLLLDLAVRRDSWPATLAAGIVVGLGTITKAAFAPFALGFWIWVAYRSRASARRMLGRLSVAVLGVLIPIAPVVARNVAVGAPPLSLSSVGAFAFLFTSTEEFVPGSTFFVGSKHFPRVMEKAEGRFLPTVMETVKTHPRVSSYAAQLLGKLDHSWHWHEVPNNTSLYYYQRHSAVLRLLPVTFWSLAPLSLVGLFLAARRFPGALPLYLLVLTTLVPLVAFYVLSRLRAPLIAALIPFAALTIVRIVEMLGGPRRWRAALLAAAVLAIGCWTGRPLPPGVALVRAQDHAAAYEAFYRPGAAAASRDGRHAEARDLFERFLAAEPPAVASLAPDQAPASQEEALLAVVFGRARGAYAEALEAAGDREGAMEQRGRMEELRRAVRLYGGGR